MSNILVFSALAIYILTLYVFAKLTKSKGDNNAFFRAGRKSPWLLVAFGMIGATISGVSLVSVPGWVHHNGMTYVQMCLGFFAGYVVISFVLLPLYYRLRLTSIYGYLSERFGRRSHLTGACFFLLSKLTGAAARLFLTCTILHEMAIRPLGLPFWFTVVVVLLAIFLYTRGGGIENIVRTDALQTACMLIAVGCIIWSVSTRMNLSLSGISQTISASPMGQMFCWDASSTQFFLRQFINGMFITIVMNGLDQDMMQKNLTCSSLKAAQKNMCLYGLLILPVNLLFLALGVLLYTYAGQAGLPLPDAGDRLLPMLVGCGALGTLVVFPFTIGIAAAALSSADSAMTSLTTSICVDILRVERDGFDPKQALRTRHLVHAGVALAFALCISLFHIAGSGTIIDTIYRLAGYTYGPLLGLFAFGLFTRRKVADQAVPYIAIISPLVCSLLDYLAPVLWNYHFSYELLLLNGALTFFGLLCFSIPMTKRLFATLSLLCCLAIPASAQQADDVLQVARRVNQYFVNKWPDPTKDTFVGRRRPSSLWTRGVYYEGLMALYSIDPQPSYLQYVDEWGNYHKWTPRNGTKTTNADDQCCMQTYLDRYLMESHIQLSTVNCQLLFDSCRVNMEKQMAERRVDYWTWIDAIQMAMPAYAKMYRITGDKRYILFARDCYEWSRNTCGGGLWNAKEGLWWRDAAFVPPYKESDGANCYWSRGNGWVVAAYVRTLDSLTPSPNSVANGDSLPFVGSQPHSVATLQPPVAPVREGEEVSDFCKELTEDYKAMMEALLKCQREDGFWNVSLMSPATFGGPETSGTALFLMGMAWGVRNGILPPQKFRPAIDKAWNAIVTTSIHPDGFIGYLQGTGKEPKDGQPVTYTSVPDFEDYGAGCVLLAAAEYYKLTKSPLSQAGARWWWLGSAVTQSGLTWQMEQMASHGIRTLEITPLYGVQGNDSNNISFLSPEWMKMLEYTINEGKRLGIQIDMNLGTGWPFGSPETPITEAACKLVVVDSLVDSNLAGSITLPAPKKEQSYARLIVQRDFKSPVKGKRRVIALYESRTRQMVKRAAPGGEGYVIDHFDSTAVAHYLSRFDRAFKQSGTPMTATFFNDSYEVFGADWTPSLLSEFQARRGYKLEDKLQEFVDGEAQVTSDYRETLSDLLLKNFTEQWVAWSHERGVKVRNQAHGSPANLIDIYAAVDIPEIEGFGLSDFGIKGLRTDSGMTRKNFSDLSMLKYASSAAHITGKKLVSSETFTWLTEHFRTSLSQMKPDLDLMFCSGVNRMFFHGACYSPKDDPWPGWRFYASVDMSPTNSIWRDANMLTGYIDFCQQRLQEGEPDNDFLVLLPVRNMWRTNLDKRLMLFEINSMEKKAPEFIASILKIDSLGYDCDYISEKYLLSTSFVNGKLQTSAGTRYAALILPPNCILSKAVRKHIEQLKKQGAHIIYKVESSELGKYAKPEELRTELHFKMIRRKVGDGYRYFVSNLTPNNIGTQEVRLASTGAIVTVSLRSGESCFIDATPDGKNTVTYPVTALQPSNSHSSLFTLHSSLLIDLSEHKWSLSFIESQPAIADKITLDGLKTWETLPNDSLKELMGTGVYETTFSLSANDAKNVAYQIDLGDVRESARVYINGTYVGCAWCVPFTLDFDNLLHEGENTIRIEVTNLPANRIAAYDRRGVKWRKFNEINVVDINYKRTTYGEWAPVPSGLNSYVIIYKRLMMTR